jgi:hypothetical protein
MRQRQRPYHGFTRKTKGDNARIQQTEKLLGEPQQRRAPLLQFPQSLLLDPRSSILLMFIRENPR